MRHLPPLTLLFLASTYTLQAQCDPKQYTRIFSEASAFQEQGAFIDAKNRYEAAKIYACSQKEKDMMDEAVDKLFEQINLLRQTAQLEREKANIAKNQSDSLFKLADKERKRAEAALDKIYFYRDRFGLSYDKKNNKYGFIDKRSNEKIEPKFIEAKSFDSQGLAQVSYDIPSLITKDKDGKNLIQYLIDTSSTEYPLEIRKIRLGRATKAVDLSYSKYMMIPIKVTQQKQLRIIRINHSKITKIPKRLGKLYYLQYMQLKNNRIKKIHEDISKLKNLESLELSGNKLKKLPKGIGGLISLKVLNLNDNEIVELPVEICDLKNLQWLSLKDNEKLPSLPEQISKLTNLRMLDVSNIGTLKTLPKDIVKLKNLTFLDLRKTGCGPKYIDQLRLDMPWCEIIFCKTGNDCIDN